METLREWLDRHPDVRSYCMKYGEDQKGGFGKKGWSAYGGKPEDFYVMDEEWSDSITGVFPTLIVTLKFFADEARK